MADIKAYKPETNSLCSGQVLQSPYDCGRAKLIVKEMADQLSLDLVEKELVTDQLVLMVGYDIENLKDPKRRAGYHGQTVTDHYGRPVPKPAHGTENLERPTSSTKKIMDAVERLYDRIMDKNLLVRRISLTANHVVKEDVLKKETEKPVQLDLFTDYEAEEKQREKEKAEAEKERRRQKAMIEIKKRFGKNAILKGMDLEEGATSKERNSQIGGHKA